MNEEEHASIWNERNEKKKYKTERFSQLLHSYFFHFSTSIFLLLLFYGRIYQAGRKNFSLLSSPLYNCCIHISFIFLLPFLLSLLPKKEFLSSSPFSTRLDPGNEREKKKKDSRQLLRSLPHSSTLLHFSLSHPSKRNPSKRKTHSKRKKGNRSKSQGRKGRDGDARGDGKNGKRGRGEVKGSERKRDETRTTKAHGTSVSALDERRRDVERRGAA